MRLNDLNEKRALVVSPVLPKQRGPMILDSGTKWEQISISPEDAEFLESRKFTVEELARIFNVPPPMIGDLSHGTFTNTETMVRLFATNTLTPWVRKLEGEFTEACSALRVGDLSGLLRGDPAQRWQSWKIAVEAGILSPDEVRAEEGWNPGPPKAPPVSVT